MLKDPHRLTMTSRTSMPLRTLAAALVSGISGLALARMTALFFANIAVPSFERALVPARFAYGPPPNWTGRPTWEWIVAGAGALVVPVLLNSSWMSRRLLSVAGIVKLLAAATLTALVGLLALTATDFFTVGPWGGGASRVLSERIVLVALTGLCGGALVALFGEGMRAGAPDAWVQTPASVRRPFAMGFAAAVAVALLAFVAVDGLNTLFRAIGYLGESAEVSPLGWSRLQLGLGVGLGLLLATCGALLSTASPEPAPRAQRLASLAVAAAPAVTLIVTTLWFNGFTRTTGEMDRTLAESAGLDTVAAPRLLVLPGKGGPVVHTYPMKVALPGWIDDTVAATAANVERTQEYLRRTAGHWTIHTAGAWHLAASVRDRLLEPEAALRARVDAAEATGSLLSTMILVTKLPRMPRSDATSEVAATLLDSTRFTGATARAKLVADTSAPHDRAVSGSVALPANVRAAARVALYRQSTGDAPTSVPSPVQLVAASALDANGRFAFSRLPAAIYAVGVLLPEGFGADAKRVSVAGALRVVDVSKERRSGDVGSITVSLREK